MREGRREAEGQREGRHDTLPAPAAHPLELMPTGQGQCREEREILGERTPTPASPTLPSGLAHPAPRPRPQALTTSHMLIKSPSWTEAVPRPVPPAHPLPWAATSLIRPEGGEGAHQSPVSPAPTPCAWGGGPRPRAPLPPRVFWVCPCPCALPCPWVGSGVRLHPQLPRHRRARAQPSGRFCELVRRPALWVGSQEAPGRGALPQGLRWRTGRAQRVPEFLCARRPSAEESAWGPLRPWGRRYLSPGRARPPPAGPRGDLHPGGQQRGGCPRLGPRGGS